MKSSSAMVRIFPFIYPLVFLSVFCSSEIRAQAQPNSWTSPTSGNWEDSTWSLGIRPAAGQDISITNAGWKAVQITDATAANFPASMIVNSITLDAPTNTVNTLLLNYVGVFSPLTAGSITTDTNTIITLLQSALNTSGTFTLNGTLNQGVVSGVTASNLYIGGVYNLTNGSLTVISNETLGGSSSPSIFNEEEDGAHHYTGQLLIESQGAYNLGGGELAGSVTVAGGTLNQTGGFLSLENLSVAAGSLVQTGGGGNIGPTTVGTMSVTPNPPIYYTLSNGTPMFNSNLTINSIGVFDQEGGSNSVKGTLSVSSERTFPDHPVLGTFTLNGGMLSAQDIFISGAFNQGGGTDQVSGDVTINGADYSRYVLAGGLLSTSNTTMLGGAGNFIQTGGRHQVSGTLSVTGGAEPAYGLYGGEVIAPTIAITYGTFSHNGGTVVNTGVLQLNGWWDEFAGEQQFGQLQIGDSGVSSLWLGTNTAVLRFADSSGQAWGSGTLTIRNWHGSITGGGGNQVIFGTNGAGLTPAQVAQIQFVNYPSTVYAAQILPTGEVVPAPSGAPYAPTGLGATGVSPTQINLTWTDNALDAIGIEIERSLDGTNFTQLTFVQPNTTSYSDGGLTPMTVYYYRIRAYTYTDDSSYTPVAEASTKWNGAPPLLGMIAWWPAENSADDVIGNHNGTTPYGIAYAPGESGQAFDFDASSYSRVFVPDSSDFNPTNGFTFEGWFYARQTIESYIGMRGDDAGGMDTWTVRRLSDGQLAFQIDDSLNNSNVISAPVQNNQWYHFAATFDKASGSMKLYLNGAVAAQTNTALQPIISYGPAFDPGIGIGNQSGTFTIHPSFDGLIDDVALYSRALTPQEIQDIYNAGPTGKAGHLQTQTNAWTSSVSGNWQDSNWSLGVQPAADQDIFITNAGWKAVQLSQNTAQNFLQTLTVNSITVSSPTNTVNTLFLNNVGVPSPLTVKSFTLGNNSVLTLLSSALQSTGSFDVGGTVNQGDFSGVSSSQLLIGLIGPATYNLTNGTLAALQSEQLGSSNYPAVFNQDGGYHYAPSLSIGSQGQYNLRDGQLGGSSLTLNGGFINQTGGDLRQTNLSITGQYLLSAGTIEASNQIAIQSGTIIQSGGTNTSGLLKLVTYVDMSSEFPLTASYVLSNGVLRVSGIQLDYFGTYEQDGGVCTVDGSIAAPAFLIAPNPGQEVGGAVSITGGILSVDGIDTAGRISQSGGTNEVLGDLTFEGWGTSSYSLSGGLLTTSNTTFKNNVGWGFYQSGGRHVVANRLSLNGNWRPYMMTGGELDAAEINITAGGQFDHAAGMVSNSSLLALDSSTWSEGTAAQVFGQLQLNGASNSASALVLPTNSPCIVHFADSSTRGWSNGVTLQIQNWNGSLTGGGSHQIIFGNSTAALTPAQLRAILFNCSGTTYPARILSTGEIVPDTAATASSTLALQAPSAGVMQLTIDGISGRTYEVDVSTDLVNWTTWTQMESTGTNSIIDTNITAHPQRFYRVRLLP